MFLVALLGYQALANDSFAEVGRRYMLQHGLDERDVDWLRFSQTVRSIAEIGNDIPGDKTLDILVTVAQWNMLDKEEVEMQ